MSNPNWQWWWDVATGVIECDLCDLSDTRLLAEFEYAWSDAFKATGKMQRARGQERVGVLYAELDRRTAPSLPVFPVEAFDAWVAERADFS